MSPFELPSSSGFLAFQPSSSYVTFYRVCLLQIAWLAIGLAFSRSFWCRRCEHFIHLHHQVDLRDPLLPLDLWPLFYFHIHLYWNKKENGGWITSLEPKTRSTMSNQRGLAWVSWPVCDSLSFIFLWSDFRLFIFSFICCRVLGAMFLLANSWLKSFSRFSHPPELAFVVLLVSFPRE